MLAPEVLFHWREAQLTFSYDKWDGADFLLLPLSWASPAFLLGMGKEEERLLPTTPTLPIIVARFAPCFHYSVLLLFICMAVCSHLVYLLFCIMTNQLYCSDEGS